jgi:hypothetical protein
VVLSWDKTWLHVTWKNFSIKSVNVLSSFNFKLEYFIPHLIKTEHRIIIATYKDTFRYCRTYNLVYYCLQQFSLSYPFWTQCWHLTFTIKLSGNLLSATEECFALISQYTKPGPWRYQFVNNSTQHMLSWGGFKNLRAFTAGRNPFFHSNFVYL